MSKHHKKKKYQGQKLPPRPEYFRSFVESVNWLKKSVYLIARGRIAIVNGKPQINWKALGTGFLCAPNRFLTAGHVINDLDHKDNEFLQHKDGDKYYLVRHDDDDKSHLAIRELHLNKQIFVYPDPDLAIIYLDDEFYQKDGKVFTDKNNFIRISKTLLSIGSQIGVLGYPLCKLEFNNRNVYEPKVGNILLRTDMGVINCRYHTSEKTFLYEFTLAFNPGNSGGPIFDINTGRVISIVRGYKTIPVSMRERVISPEEAKQYQLKKYKKGAFIEVTHATYSLGFAVCSFLQELQKHNIAC